MFALSILAQYLALCSLTALLMGLRHSTAIKMRSKVKCILLLLHLVYLACLIVGMIDSVGAKCSTSNSYTLPIIFYCKDGCYALYYVLLLALHSQKYLIDWNDPGQSQLKDRAEKDSVREREI